MNLSLWSVFYAVLMLSSRGMSWGVWVSSNLQMANTSMEYNPFYDADNMMPSSVAWEHEQFSRLGVTAATLSGLSAPPDLLESTGGLLITGEFSESMQFLPEFVNEVAVVKSVKVVAESLARHIYGQQGKNINILADNSSLAVNPSYIRSWLDLMSRTPRVVPFLSRDSALKKELADHVSLRDFHKPKTGSVVAFKVNFRDFSPVGSNIWFKRYGPPSDRDVDLNPRLQISQ
ncbi:nicalin isoform X1 [Tanacetum coccineum]